MCTGVLYSIGNRDVRVLFPARTAMLPVVMRSGRVEQVAWGRRKHQQGQLPLGGWVRREAILAGNWDRFMPRPVKIPVHAFMETDYEGAEHWYELTKGQWLQGLLAKEKDRYRVYVVTIEPAFEDSVHERWPRIVSVTLS